MAKSKLITIKVPELGNCIKYELEVSGKKQCDAIVRVHEDQSLGLVGGGGEISCMVDLLNKVVEKHERELKEAIVRECE